MKIQILITILLIVTACSPKTIHWESLRIVNGDSPGNDIRSICFDRGDKMWVGTWNGVYKNVDGQWLAQGPATYVETLFISHDDTKWVGLWGGGVFKSITGEQWEKVSDASPSGSVNVISSDNKGNLWVGDWAGGAVNFDGEKWSIYKAGDVKLGDNTVTSIICSPDHCLWFGTYHGLSKFENGTWTLYNNQNSKLPDNDVYTLASDSKGAIWVGTINGLARLSDEKWEVFRKENSGLVDNLILSIAEDSSGNIWVGTNKGVSVFDGSIWKTYTNENSKLVDNRVQVIKVWNKKVYMGTGNGISVIE
jgi:ligand-binding sensor domain-containing protein